MPYLPGGLRMEHIIAPALALWAILRARSVHMEVALPVLALGVSLFAVIVSSIFSHSAGLMAEPLTYFIRLLTPTLLIMGMPNVLAPISNATLSTAKATVVAASVVAILTLVSSFVPIVLEFLTFWIRSEEGSTWMISQEVGRNSGIFNQPLEAGLFYSVALLCLVYAWSFSKWSKLILSLFLIAILIGGALSLSKNFLVLGVGLAIAYAFMMKVISARTVILLGVPLVLLAPSAYKFNYNYFDSLYTLYYEGGLVAAVSAGRFGLNESEVSILFQQLWTSGDWLTGRGLGSHLPLDNGYLEFFYQGGVIALIGYIVALGAITIHAASNSTRPEGKILLVVSIYIWLASLGGPVISAGRANVALLLLTAACLVDLRPKPLQLRSDRCFDRIHD